MRTVPLLALILSGCIPSNASAPPLPAPTPADAVQLRTWELPEGYAPRLVASLNRALQPDGSGRASDGPHGSLVMVGPQGVLDGVDALVQRTIAATDVPIRHNVELQYWLVYGEPAASPSRTPELATIGPALEAILTNNGPQALTLAGSRRLRSLDGERGRLADGLVEVTQVVDVEPGTEQLLADVKIVLPRTGAVVETRVSLQEGNGSVVSQSVVDQPGGPSMLYVIVRPRIVTPPTGLATLAAAQ